MISLMWDTKLKATNEQTIKTNKSSQTQTIVRWYQRKGGGVLVKGKGDQIYVTEDRTLGGGHIMPYAGDVSQRCTLETYVILLTKVTTMNLMKIFNKR